MTERRASMEILRQAQLAIAQLDECVRALASHAGRESPDTELATGPSGRTERATLARKQAGARRRARAQALVPVLLAGGAEPGEIARVLAERLACSPRHAARLLGQIVDRS